MQKVLVIFGYSFNKWQYCTEVLQHQHKTTTNEQHCTRNRTGKCTTGIYTKKSVTHNTKTTRGDTHAKLAQELGQKSGRIYVGGTIRHRRWMFVLLLVMVVVLWLSTADRLALNKSITIIHWQSGLEPVWQSREVLFVVDTLLWQTIKPNKSSRVEMSQLNQVLEQNWSLVIE